jgi:7-cyano-7-deazaguanine synthase
MDVHQPQAVILLSGGLDSMVAGGIARAQGFAINALTIDYNQRHRREIDSARTIAKLLGARSHVVLPLDLRQFGGSALTDEIDVPKGGLEDGIPVTYVPARNLVFLSLTLAWAEAIDAHDIFIGVNALDYSGYPDCRPDFINSFQETARLATRDGVQGKPFTIHTPLQYWGKARIAKEAVRLGFDPSVSWSCYDPTLAGLPCGLCDSCRLRRKGFAEAGLVDPTIYADPA